MVWGCMSAAGTGELQFIEGTMNANMYCDILKQSMIPSLRRLGRRAVFQHDNKHWLAKEAEGKGDGLAKHVSRPRTELRGIYAPHNLWGIFKWKVEERKVSNIHQLRDVIMEEWKRTPVATCEALVNSMPKSVKAVLENNGGHTKILTLWAQFGHFHSKLWTLVASGLDINGCVTIYTYQLYQLIPAVHSLLYIVAKYHFFSVVTWTDRIKYLQNIGGVRGVFTPVRYCRYRKCINKYKNKLTLYKLLHLNINYILQLI